MQIEELFTIKSNDNIAKDVYRMELEGNTELITKAGQFVNITVPGKYLRRPISVCDVEGNVLTLIYKVFGSGTDIMSKMQAGETLSLLVGLGNGYNLDLTGDRCLIVGGGVGVPPMYWLAKKLIAQGKHPVAVFGFASREDVFYEKEFKALGIDTYVATVDGSYGEKGFVTDVIKKYDLGGCHYMACGPMPMLKALFDLCGEDCQLSFEERMGCGFGACMGCSIETKNGYKRVCKDGPVLLGGEIKW